MPPGGAGVRAEQIATLDPASPPAPALGRARRAARPGRRTGLDSAPHDSFEASLVRVSAARVGEGAPGARRAAGRDRARDLDRRARLGGRARTRRLRRLPPPPRARDRARAPLHRVLRRRAPLRPAARRLRARDAHRGARARADASPRRHGRAARRDHGAGRRASTPRACYGDFPVDRQAELARRDRGAPAARAGAWRIDETVHPFATGIGISDLRITTRFDPATSAPRSGR